MCAGRAFLDHAVYQCTATNPHTKAKAYCRDIEPSEYRAVTQLYLPPPPSDCASCIDFLSAFSDVSRPTHHSVAFVSALWTRRTPIVIVDPLFFLLTFFLGVFHFPTEKIALASPAWKQARST